MAVGGVVCGCGDVLLVVGKSGVGLVLSRVVGWNDAFAALDLGFLHLHRSVRTMELVVEPAGVADGVAGLVAPPEGRDGGAAILARDNDTRRASRMVVVYNVADMSRVGAGRRSVGGGLPERNLGRFRDAIVVRWTAVAAVMAARAITPATPRTGPVVALVGRYVGGPTLHGSGR